jgi:membrane protease YdiL (CAAX protease family)
MRSKRSLWFLFFLITGLTVFIPSITFSSQIPDTLETFLRVGLCLLFLVLTMVFARRREEKLWPIPFAFFLTVFSQFLAWQFSGLPVRWLRLDVTAINGMALAKLSQSLLIIVSIICLTKASGQNLASIYIKKGKIKYGLSIGLLAFFVFTVFLVLQAKNTSGGLSRLLTASPWIFVFVIANGFNEELLFRGLFLRKFEPFLGKFGSNLLTAIVFTLAHIKVEYVMTGEILRFLAVVFVLAIVWGYLMQKTDSLIGPAIFHAGADLLLFSSLFTLIPS